MVSLIRLASTSKAMQLCVYQDCAFLWTTIDFTSVDKKLRKRLRDRHVEALLRLTNASSVACSINLYSCGGLRGSGIAPLFGSNVLEEIDLRFGSGKHDHHDPIPDASTVCRVINSMPPFSSTSANAPVKLRFIRMDEYDLPHTVHISAERRANAMKMMKLRGSLGTKLARRMVCEDCQKPILDCITPNGTGIPDTLYSDEWMSLQANGSICHECKHCVCGRDDAECRKILCCDECKGQACTMCSTMKSCRGCGKYTCCLEWLCCQDCKQTQCISCDENEQGGIETLQCSGKCSAILCRFRIVRCYVTSVLISLLQTFSHYSMRYCSLHFLPKL